MNSVRSQILLGVQRIEGVSPRNIVKDKVTCSFCKDLSINWLTLEHIGTSGNGLLNPKL
jgi:hypothetical protein